MYVFDSVSCQSEPVQQQNIGNINLDMATNLGRCRVLPECGVNHCVTCVTWLLIVSLEFINHFRMAMSTCCSSESPLSSLLVPTAEPRCQIVMNFFWITKPRQEMGAVSNPTSGTLLQFKIYKGWHKVAAKCKAKYVAVRQ